MMYLNDQELLALGITTREIIEAIESAIIRQKEQSLWTAPKSVILPDDGRYIMSTLSAANKPGMIAVKSVMVSPTNPSRGLPGVNGAIMLLDSETGQLLGVMDAGWVTAVRTAGLSTVIAKRIANPSSSSVAFIGCGVQARSHFDAFSELFPIKEVFAVGRSKEKIHSFCRYVNDQGIEATAAVSAKEAIESADIIVSSITLSYDLPPFLDASWLQPGAFAAITDLAIPWIPETMCALGKVIIDDHEQEASAEKPMVIADFISADMTELVTKEKDISFAPNESSAFVFRGLALGDFAVAALAYSRATQ